MQSRRQFLRLAATAGVVGMLAACGTTAAPLDTKTTSQSTGTLRLVHTLEWAGKEVLHPASPVRFFPTIELLYNGLVRLDQAGQLKPELAESWKSNDAATEWTFALRKNVTFHNGAPFTAKDVLYTLNTVMDPKLESPGAAVLALHQPHDRSAGPGLRLRTHRHAFARGDLAVRPDRRQAERRRREGTVLVRRPRQ